MVRKPQPPRVTRAVIRRELLALAETRGPRKTFCPSEAARHLAPGDWRPLLPAIRAAAAALIAEGRLRALQRGQEISIENARGPIRLAAPE